MSGAKCQNSMKQKLFLQIFIILFLLFVAPLFASKSVIAATCPTSDPCKDTGSVFDKVSCYNNIVNICASQRESMAAQVTYLTTKIELTSTKIVQTKEKIIKLGEEIEEISGKIDNLENSLTKITGMLIDRIQATYKHGNISYLDILLVSGRFSDFINRYKYIQTVQTHDRRLLFQLQNSKENFKDQKQLR